MTVMLLLVGFLATGAPCWGAPQMVLVDRSNGRYEVMGQGLAEVKEMTLVVTYDPAMVSAPQVKQNGLIYGAMMIPDFSVPGTIRVGITSSNPHQGISGDGSIAMISFTVATRGKAVSSFTATLVSTSGTPIPMPAPQVLSSETGRFRGNPFYGSSDTLDESTGMKRRSRSPAASGPSAEPVEQPSAPVTDAGVAASGAGASAAAAMGAPATATISSGALRPEPDLPEIVELAPAPPGNVSSAVSEPPGAQGDRRQAAAAGAPAGTSILSRFKGYAGPLTIQGVTDLFARHDSPRILQKPSVVLTDGVTKVTATLTLPAPPGQSPNFALVGARQLSLKRTGTGYLLELIPDRGGIEASVLVLLAGTVTEYPLVVAPPLNPALVPGGRIDDAAFTAFLQGYAEGRGDPTGDGRTDYLDLYLYTANYLVRKGAAAPAAPSVPVPVSPGVPAAPGAAVAPSPAVPPAVPVPAAPVRVPPAAASRAPVPPPVVPVPVAPAAPVPAPPPAAPAPAAPVHGAPAAVQSAGTVQSARHVRKSKHAKKRKHAKKKRISRKQAKKRGAPAPPQS